MSKSDSAQLSSNWKKLQEKLAIEKKSGPSTGAKRKRPATEQKDARKGNVTADVKKRKVFPGKGERPRRPAKMGAWMSSQPEGGSTKANGTTTRNDGHDTTSASATGQTATNPSKGSFQDIPNSGIVPKLKAGKYVGLDCEMVGTGPPPYNDHVLARASLVNFHGEQIYDSYVLPPAGIKIHDYRTHVSGITPELVRPGFARPFAEVQREVMDLVEGRILVGHALKNDLQVLQLNHAKRDLRDTSRHPKYRLRSRGKPPALRDLARDELGLRIQEGAHSSVEDARVAMALFRREKTAFEEENRRYYGQSGRRGEPSGGDSAKRNGVTPDQESDDEELEEEADESSFLDGEEDEFETLSGSTAVVKQPSTGQKPKKKRKKKSRTKRK